VKYYVSFISEFIFNNWNKEEEHLIRIQKRKYTQR
jgi:hypothetical protein